MVALIEKERWAALKEINTESPRIALARSNIVMSGNLVVKS